MHIKKTVSIFLLSLMAACRVFAAGFVTEGDLLTPEAWILDNDRGDAVIMDQEQIEKYNALLREKGLICPDFRTMSNEVDGAKVRAELSDPWVLRMEKLYHRGTLVTDEDKDKIRANIDASVIPDKIAGRYAVLVRHGLIRNLPTAEAYFSDPREYYCDSVQESSVEMGEPCLVLHTSKNGKYCYAQFRRHRGWIREEDIAFCDKEKWLEYVDPEQFVVLTDRETYLPVDGEEVYLMLGTKIRYTKAGKRSYNAMLPYRDKNGDLREKAYPLPKSDAFHDGYLPYTSDNVIKEAFKFLGSVYGWGGVQKSVDCSGLFVSVYDTMGIVTPRNSGEIRKAPGHQIDFAALSTQEEKLSALDRVRPGSALNMKGHVLMYLGKKDGVPYVLHSISSYYIKGRKVYIRRVAVSDLSLCRKSGRTFLEDILNSTDFSL